MHATLRRAGKVWNTLLTRVGPYLAILAIVLAFHFYSLEVDATRVEACHAISQVRKAIDHITEPVAIPVADGSDIQDQRIATIKAANAAKVAARVDIDKRLACG